MISSNNEINANVNLITLGKERYQAGYWMGMRQSSYKVDILVNKDENISSALNRYDNLYYHIFESSLFDMSSRVIDSNVSNHPVLGRLLIMATKTLEKIGMPIIGGANAVRSDPEKNQERWIVGLPAITENIKVHKKVFRLVCILMNEFNKGSVINSVAVKSEIEKLKKEFSSLVPSGVNTVNFIEAAHELKIPWHHVANNVFQFGWGSKSRWLDSSFTDETSTISASLARDKVDCVKVLRDSGLPVPKQYLVSSVEEAIKVAETTGYPIVVKPANLDGGLGVSAGIRNVQSLKRSYEVAAKLSKRVLVEEFIEGNDYRFRVCKNEVIGIVARRPASVIGNGVDSVNVLIDKINHERLILKKYDPEIEIGFKPITIDDEVMEWLSYQNLNLCSIINRGHRVRLRGAANIMLGGSTWDVMRTAHIDNINLALSAVKSLRLDLAGVDVLLPDITKSWKESGGAICEVNGQPQLPKGIAHKQVLQRLIDRQGRIPLIVIESFFIELRELNLMRDSSKLSGINILISDSLEEGRRALQSINFNVVILILNEYSIETSWPFDSLELFAGTADSLKKLNEYGLYSNEFWLVDSFVDKSKFIFDFHEYIKKILKNNGE